MSRKRKVPQERHPETALIIYFRVCGQLVLLHGRCSKGSEDDIQLILRAILKIQNELNIED